jgi:hypothetical protein
MSSSLFGDTAANWDSNDNTTVRTTTTTGTAGGEEQQTAAATGTVETSDAWASGPQIISTSTSSATAAGIDRRAAAVPSRMQRLRDQRSGMRVSTTTDAVDDSDRGSTWSAHPPPPEPGGTDSAAGASPEDNAASLPDRITAQAVAGALELLRQLGGATLSTTGALVAPPLYVTRTILLPQLWTIFREYLAQNSPHRLQDWFRIVHSGVYHVIHTLRNTENGHVFRQRLLIAAVDLVDCLSMDTARQLFLDVTSAVVHFAEAMHTPEVRRFLEQSAVTFCRLLDVLADGRSRLLCHDLAEAAWSATAVAADPATTVAVAEVAAYLVYALEMEQQNRTRQHQPRQHQQQQPPPKNSKQRHERSRYQAATATDHTLIAHADMTVEEAILGSLGHAVTTDHSSTCDHASSATYPIDQASASAEAAESWKQSSSSIRQKVRNCGGSTAGGTDEGADDDDDREKSAADEEAWHERARKGVDVQFLRQGIEQRAVFVQPLKQRQSPASVPPKETEDLEELVVTTVGSDDDEEEGGVGRVREVSGHSAATAIAANKRPRTAVQALTPDAVPVSDDEIGKKETVVGFKIADEDGWDQTSAEHEERLEGESASQHFHRVLDEILTQKRKAAVATAMEQKGVLDHCGTMRRPGMSKSTSSVKERINRLRSEFRAAIFKQPQDLSDLQIRTAKVLGNRGKLIFAVGLAMFAGFVLLWFCLGCYGLWVYFHPVVPNGNAAWLMRNNRAPDVKNQLHQEIVIRVVKEVVHVNEGGKELGRGLWHSHHHDETLSAKDYEKVAECVAKIYN